MKDRNIFAYTAPESDFPDYLSINRRDERIVISVRGCRGHHSAEMTLPQEELDALIYALRGARINPLIGSGHKPKITDVEPLQVPTSHLEKAQMKIKRKPL